jgi:lipoate-protein ligase A
MLCIKSISTDPYFNLAMEEFLLKETDREYFLTYINEPSVIIGKHQNAYAEINFDFIRRNNIKVARRLTGGGTVFHDSGNLNYVFIVNGREGQLVDFKKHTRPVIDFLKTLSVEAEFAGKNDLLVNGDKISGSAEHVFRNRVLHHGTLLFDATLSSLSDALKVNPLKYKDKAVRSIRSRVSNISGNLGEKISIHQMRDRLTGYIRKGMGGEDYRLTRKEQERISALRDEKFSTWEWNFGYGPKYTLTSKINRDGRVAEVELEVARGLVVHVSLQGNLFSESCRRKICEALVNNPHQFNRLSELFSRLPGEACFQYIDPDEFTRELF